jgi:4-hydroxythreonine-4-phosphate dehydrogenase
MDKPIVGFSVGDLNGIGLEVLIKLFSDTRMMDTCVPVLFASSKAVNFYRKITSTEHPFNFNSIQDLTQINPKQVNVLNCWDEEVQLQPGTLNETGGQYAVRSLMTATQCLKDGTIDILVTAPIHKNNTQSSDFPYTGHTPYLKHSFEVEDVVMMLYSGSFRVALITEHIPVAQVAAHISTDLIVRKIQLIKHTLIQDFGIDKPKIAVLGLNPHAGDEGLIGTEEQTIITPAIQILRDAGTLAFGPFSADGYFARGHYTQFDATIAMYHDQGLIPFKTIAADRGVNYTCGLPVIRTSPDHGVAFDIAGKSMANPDSMREAIFEAVDLYQQRRAYKANTANPVKKHRLTTER